METPKFKLADIFNGVVIPIILVLLIFFLAIYVNVSGTYHILGANNTIAVILTSGFAQMIILGIPLILGLLWNKWAGGAAGFIMGGMYYVASAGLYNGYYAGSNPPLNFFGDMSMLSYLVMAVIIGYMAGALNNGSSNFKRMLGAGLTAAIVTATIQAYFNYTVSLAPARTMNHGLWANTSLGIAGLYGFVLQFIPNIALGVIVPILAKVMTWYGIQPQRHQ
ncbi:MAG TPA: hypothetical protein VLU95_06050 [Candidatus Acidoferrum sp.]|nr:hypothetical protein [Candidatus Acidoferrum sp.]